MMFKLAAVVPLFSLFVSSAMAAGSVTTCYSGCMSKAAASVGCAITDHRCVQQAVGTFKSIATQCLEDQACKTLADSTQAELERAAEAPAGEFDGMLGEGASAVMSRVTPRGTGLRSLERPDCPYLSVVCTQEKCNKECQNYHKKGRLCVINPGGNCTASGCECDDWRAAGASPFDT